VQRAIRAMLAARDALEPLYLDEPRDSVTQLRVDLREYAEYLETARWWRKDRRETP
jgi:hypothetical protein